MQNHCQKFSQLVIPRHHKMSNTNAIKWPLKINNVKISLTRTLSPKGRGDEGITFD
jgi:hypothetical protein